jgi:hypothetical protein
MKRLSTYNLILSLILAIFATGCSANYHLNKAIKKGYRLERFADTIRIQTIDSFPVIMHDSIIWEKFVTTKDTVIQIQKEYIPKTRLIKRFDLKRFNDSLNYMRRIYSDSLRYALKSNKTQLKTNLKKQKVKQDKTFTDTMKFVAVSLFLIFLIILMFKISKYLGLNNVQ